nr:MAG TPA: hypothetical protein [Caudoviricetes sp.]
MNYIQPITRPINNQSLVEWRNEHVETREVLDDFLNNMKAQGIEENKAKEMWLQNFGVIPPVEPDRFYQCNIITPDVKLTVTVLKRNNILAGQRKYDVVKLNNLYIDTYDYVRKLTVNEKGEIVFVIQHKDLSQEIDLTVSEDSIEDSNILELDKLDSKHMTIEYLDDQEDHPLNYEDSNWLTNLHISNLLNKIKIGIKPYVLPNDDENPGRPKLYLNNMDYMESSEFEFTDKQFEQKLFDEINDKFIKIESELK